MTFRIFLIIFLLVAGATGVALWVANAEAVDRYTMELRGLAPNVEILDIRIAEQKELVRLKVNGNAVAVQIAEKTRERDELEKAVQAITLETSQMKDRMARAIVEIREKSIGLQLAEVILPNRPPLKNAEIQSITADGVRFKHADGVTLARQSDLPTDLQERLRFDEAPLERDWTSVPAKPAAAPKDDASAKHRDKVKKLQSLITQYTYDQEDLQSRWDKIVTATRESNNTSNRYKAEEARKQLYAQYVAAKDRLKVAQREMQRLLENAPE